MGIKHFWTDNCLWDSDAQPLVVYSKNRIKFKDLLYTS